MSERRVVWVDALKGIGIVCVILGHMQIPEMLRQFIFSFHMPLFFFVSGYLFRGVTGRSWWVRKFNALVIPYVLYSILYIGIRYYARGDNPMDLLRMFLKGNGTGVTWFFVCLLLTNVIGAMIVRVAGGRSKVVAAGIAACVGVGLLGGGLPHFAMIPAVFPATAIWLVGYIVKKNDVLEMMLIQKTWLKAVASVLLALGSSLFILQRVDMQGAQFGNHLLFYSTSSSIVLALCLIMSRVAKNGITFLNYCGRNSMLIFVWHGAVAMLVGKIFLMSGLEMTLVTRCFLRMFSLVILFSVTWLIDNYFPLLAGRGCKL